MKPERYDTPLPAPENDEEAEAALAEDAADGDPEADFLLALGNAKGRATHAQAAAENALAEARAYYRSANHHAYNGPVSAAQAAARSADRAAARASKAWVEATEAADDCSILAEYGPDRAFEARDAAEGARVNARLARLAAHEARKEADEAERHERNERAAKKRAGTSLPLPGRDPDAPACLRCGRAPGIGEAQTCPACKEADAQAVAAGSDQRPPAPATGDQDSEINALLLNAHAAFTGLAASASDEEARTEFADRRDRTARLLHARGAWPWAAHADPAAPDGLEWHECPACTDPTLTGAAGRDGLCETCEKAEARKAQA